jgi:hypothetical protein
MSNGNEPHVDWWRDGRVITQLVTIIVGFAVTWVTLIYQGEQTRGRVQVVEDRQVDNTKSIEEVKRDVRKQGVKMGVLPPTKDIE